MLKIWRLFRGRGGFTLSELVVAGAVMGTVATGGSMTYARYMRANQEMDLKDVMSTLRKETETALTSPQNLVRTLGHAENNDFRNCFGSASINANATGIQITKKMLWKLVQLRRRTAMRLILTSFIHSSCSHQQEVYFRAEPRVPREQEIRTQHDFSRRVVNPVMPASQIIDVKLK